MMEEQGGDEYEEEDILIFVEIDGLVATEALDVQTTAKPFFKIMGLDTDTPFMQIGNEYFTGEFTEPMGSTLLFEGSEPLRYFGKTSKHVSMRRAFLHQKNRDETETIPRPSYLDDALLTTLPDKMAAEYLSLDQQEARSRLASDAADIDKSSVTDPCVVGEDQETTVTEVSRSLPEQMDVDEMLNG